MIEGIHHVSRKLEHKLKGATQDVPMKIYAGIGDWVCVSVIIVRVAHMPQI